jgi:NAD(P)H dehydrogenase (quinone)
MHLPKILIVFYSKSGNTEEMAHLIAEGAMQVHGIDVKVKSVLETEIEELLQYDGIIIGSPTYYGTMCAEIKEIIDKSVKFHGQLENKVGGAFSSSAQVAGGNETTIMNIIKALMIHGMIVQGSSSGDHYGPVSIGKPDLRSKKLCIEYGKMVSRLVTMVSKAKANL